ncbi:hypothetical protein AMTR_s00102p00122820 [Amborella trichopoda]|uniref:Uncharacterized protein n=1 Tax=Amborella trichopoda TaxID=13333 RepID=W1NT88_AMBTC|nr:hypothetical protein AMTR_s00102p00122820 [Amborella trichopoda]
MAFPLIKPTTSLSLEVERSIGKEAIFLGNSLFPSPSSPFDSGFAGLLSLYLTSLYVSFHSSEMRLLPSKRAVKRTPKTLAPQIFIPEEVAPVLEHIPASIPVPELLPQVDVIVPLPNQILPHVPLSEISQEGGVVPVDSHLEKGQSAQEVVFLLEFRSVDQSTRRRRTLK